MVLLNDIAKVFRQACGMYPPPKVYHQLQYALCHDTEEQSLRAILKKYPDATRWCKKGDLPPLVYALWQGQRGQAAVLIEHDKDLLSDNIYQGVTVVRYHLDSLANLSFLANQGADFHRVDDKGNTLLHHAVLNSMVPAECIEYLLSKGIDVNKPNHDGETAMMVAAKNDDGRRAPSFRAMANPDMTLTTSDGKNLLMIAGFFAVDDVLSTGVGLEEKSPEGMTALEHALKDGRHSVAQKLLESGAQIHSESPLIQEMLTENTRHLWDGLHEPWQIYTEDYITLCEVLQDMQQARIEAEYQKKMEQDRQRQAAVDTFARQIETGVEKPLMVKRVERLRLR